MSHLALRHLHIGCAALSIALFVLRGVLQHTGQDWRQSRWLRVLPHLNDTVLLAAAITLAVQSGLYPLAQHWLTAKVAALLLYIGLGHHALRRNPHPQQKSPPSQRLAFIAALATVAYIVGTAITRSPHWGWLD